MSYFIVGLICFIVGFWIAARFKDNITIGFGNQTITTINGEVQKDKDGKNI